ncbi:single-stranded DNA-binding protein [Streptomyces sp. MBT53]|uniref:single-stranded DNA-binding protein n=1 Tax=Streptomyces sp. MBT53 TaxID=1488384 RepID=UPI001913C110|nr:single-stranded DNA-binding protein [Streptomyces sp. MBT53]MBK6018674.1 single-stranded DNA-binding protein [Streptomyces sp. MBT53]
MTGETVVTITGNLVADPEIRFTEQGTPVARFRVASTPRVYDRRSGQWTDGESLFITCTVWRHVAEHVGESLQRGMHVIVQGRLRQRTYTDHEGIRRTVFDLDADDVGLSLRHRIAYTDSTLPSALARPPIPAPPPAVQGAPGHERQSRPQRHGGWSRIR